MKNLVVAFGLGILALKLHDAGVRLLEDWRWQQERPPRPPFEGHSDVNNTAGRWGCECHGSHFLTVYFEDDGFGELGLEEFRDNRLNDWTDLYGLWQRVKLMLQVLYGKQCTQVSVNLDPDTARDIGRALFYGADRLEAYYDRQGFEWRDRNLKPLRVPDDYQVPEGTNSAT